LPDSLRDSATAEALHAVVELDLTSPPTSSRRVALDAIDANAAGIFNRLLGTIDICRLNCVMVVLPGIILAALRDDDDRRK
jgi:hypothetical protein